MNTTANKDGIRGNVTELDYSSNSQASNADDTYNNIHRSLSTLNEVASVTSDAAQSNGSMSNIRVGQDYDGHYADEVEIVDADSPTQLYRSTPPSKTGRNFLPQIRSSSTRELRSMMPEYVSKGGHVFSAPYPESGGHPDVQHVYKRPKQEQSQRRQEWEWDQEAFAPAPKLSYDYWTLPRAQDIFRRDLDIPESMYQTPGARLYSRRHQSSRLGYKYRKGRRGKDERSGHDKSPNDQNGDEPNSDTPHRSELKVYFRFSKAGLGPEDYLHNEALMIALQAHCRGFLARQKFDKKLEEDNAVRIIQRNAQRIFSPWFRLLMALRPLLKTHRAEEEILFLKSELERYKTLIKMLRFENAEYQAKVANLLQLIEQINTNGVDNANVNKLVQQVSEALSKNQEYWQEMAANNKALQASVMPRPPGLLESESSPTPGRSTTPIAQLRQDADFYRNQVELLKEEADEEQHRSSEHFQGQVNVLGDRVEQLQNLLSLESAKVERLSSELEDMNATVAESKNYERNLELMVSQLSKQLEQRNKEKEQAADEAAKAPAVATPSEKQEEAERQLRAYKDQIRKLRAYLSSNPKALSVLSNSPFQPGGQYDLFNEPHLGPALNEPLTVITPMGESRFFAQAPSPNRDDRMMAGELTPRSASEHEVVELRRHLAECEKQLAAAEDQLKMEVEDREALENENVELHNRVCALDRQVRRTQDEYDEAMTRRDLANQRKVRELQDQLEDEIRKSLKFQQQNKELEMQLTELKKVEEPEDEGVDEEWEKMKTKLRADLAHYKRSLEIVQEEYDEFRRQNDPAITQKQLSERDDKISELEKEQQQWRMEMDVQQVKLQNATSLLEDSESRIKILAKERQQQIHRISQLEQERDDAIREAANVSGRASAEKEAAAAKARELDEIRSERDLLRKELAETKQELAGITAENAAEKRQLQARLKDAEQNKEERIKDLKAELDRAREENERLQVELQSLQQSDLEHKTASQQSKWKIDELEDQLTHSMRRIGTLERQAADLDAELSRAKADVSAASLRRLNRSRLGDDWIQWGQTTDDGGDTDEDERNFSLADPISETSDVPGLSKRKGSGIMRPCSQADMRSPSAYERSFSGRGSLSRLDRLDSQGRSLLEGRRSNRLANADTLRGSNSGLPPLSRPLNVNEGSSTKPGSNSKKDSTSTENSQVSKESSSDKVESPTNKDEQPQKEGSPTLLPGLSADKNQTVEG
ncbi:unnamed protein product [Calicophoron daubneyi]|uniref:Uncharacterized protein n=1 Tax=Calicophoron daubneyi TaxID=300641 RepID=A0AAV2TBP1_CALDB